VQEEPDSLTGGATPISRIRVTTATEKGEERGPTPIPRVPGEAGTGPLTPKLPPVEPKPKQDTAHRPCALLAGVVSLGDASGLRLVDLDVEVGGAEDAHE
jgi:hypothetical protein